MLGCVVIVECVCVCCSVGGGELLRHVLLEEAFEEPLAARMVQQTLHALAYLHTHNIVHMDVKVSAGKHGKVAVSTRKVVHRVSTQES